MNYRKLVAGLGVAAVFSFLIWFARISLPQKSATPQESVAQQNDSSAVPATLALRSIPATVSMQTQATVKASEIRVQPDSAREPQFAAFKEWLQRYENTDASGKAILEGEGKILAQARLTAFADLVQSDPERALALALPRSVYGELPTSIRELVERPINTVGDLAVIATLPMSGIPSDLPPVFRTAIINGETYHAFTFGTGLNFITKKNVPLNGYAVPTSAATKPPANPLVRASQMLVIDPNPVRVLAKSEIDEIKNRQPNVNAPTPDPLCQVSGEPWLTKNTEAAGEAGGTTVLFCEDAHLKLWAAQVAAAGSVISGGETKSLTTAESRYTEGRKRMLLMRPYWNNQPIAMDTNAAITHFNNFSNYMWQMSYGKLRFATLGQGSDISAELLIPGDVNSYVAGLGDGAGEAWQAVRDVARTNYAYDLTKYDFIYYVTTGKPSASYGGLGFVGGVGFHLANGSFDASTSSHEFGHNLGLNHAHFWDTSQASIIGNGLNVEYGDSNDPMGGGGNPNQYNSAYKNFLGWITNSEIATIPATGSNRYRLYSFDLDHGAGLRGLKFVRTASQNYWINFRQRKTSSAALMNGVQLLWTGNASGNTFPGSYLLDVRLRGSAGNNAVVIGRTFSDTNLHFHFTPIGKGNTYPESIDIVAVTGPQPGNLPPIATLNASTLTPNTGQAVTFSASASDPNGDALAYYWEFGDGAESYSSDNKPTQVRSFASAGEYAVRCVVSDMRGGTAQRTLVVRVGNPLVFRISGHVTDQYSKGAAGALVTAGSKSVYVDSDGSYVIPGLAAGSYNVSAMEPIRGAVELVHPFFNNPVVVGPSAQNIDFIVGTSAPPALLVATGAVWKYLDDGTDQGTAWSSSSFIDTNWKSGASQLGYGESDETTRIEDNATSGYVSTDTDRHITYYFRRTFNVANPSALTNFVLNVQRDDGAIVYLNGVEVFRNNMPAGAVNYLTTALATSEEPSIWFQTNISASLLVTGTNVLAAEVHQESPSSSDVTFNLFLSASSANNMARAAIVYVGSPADNAVFTSPTNITVAAMANSTPLVVTNVEIFDGATLLGASSLVPYSAPLNNPTNGVHLLRAVSVDTSGFRRTSSPVRITINAPLNVALTMVQTGAVWSYYCTNFGASDGWQNPGFDDATWNRGAARLGFNAGNLNLATVIDGGPAADRHRTAYFRRAFAVNDPASVTNLMMQLARDDGAVIYLNGVEILRNNIPNGVAPNYSMLATNALDSGSIYSTFTVPTGALVPGTNILAAEVHQAATNSTDLIFDLGLSGLAATNRERGCWLVAPMNGGSIPLPGNATLTAQVVAGNDLSVTTVEFYSDGAKIGEDVASPFSFTWNNPPGGAHALVAVAYDSAGASITSAPINVTMTSPPAGDAFVSFGETWKYLDDGSDAGTAWRTGAYNDNQWMSGPGRLGYGGDGEITTVSYGQNASFKYVTTYFRKKFVVSGPVASFNGLLLRLLRDDGVAVYLNGTEIFRTNLLAGPINYNSLATSAITGADETTPFDVLLSAAGLVSGTNTIAVEMHQDSITSSDLGFNLALIGLRNTNTSDGIYITSPAQNARYNMPATISLSAHAMVPEGAMALVEYFNGATRIGQSAASPYLASWNNGTAGIHSLTAVATFAGNERMTSPPISVVVGPAPAPIAPTFTPYIFYGSQWKYWDSAAAVSNGWTGLLFDDSTWPASNARFGWGIDGEATLLTQGRMTHYFRKSFEINNGSALDSLTFNVVRDDGVVVYLNGVEVFRTNMPAGPIGGTTSALVTIDPPDETIPVTHTIATVNAGLLNGTNVVAVELHQKDNSSDASFDLYLYGEGTTEPRIYLGAPANNSIQTAGLPIRLEAHAQGGTGRTLTAVEFFSDGTYVGQATTFPYRFNWSNASTGLHTIVARSLDNLGNSLTSAPVQIRVGYQPVTLVLVPAGAVWRYLDNGSNQGTNWARTNFNDASWEFGPAEFGYGENDEATRIEDNPAPGYNGSDQNRYITYYFRHSFIVPPDTFLTNLTFRLLRDDGAVVWLNGREMYRTNLPAGTLTYTTPASTSVSGADETTFFVRSMAATNIYPGTNLIAVEIHQQSADSSDVSFNLQLDGDGYFVSTMMPVLVAENVNGQLLLSWPASATGFQLVSCSDLGANWQPVNLTPVTNNGFKVMTIPATNVAAFYRLQK